MSNTTPYSAFLKIEDPIGKKVRLDGVPLGTDMIELTPGSPLIIGRNPRIANLQFFDTSEISSVSRLHCTIVFDDEFKRYMLTDEGSSNGSYINDKRLQAHKPAKLHDGDIIRLGSLTHKGVELFFSRSSNDSSTNKRLVFNPADPAVTVTNERENVKESVGASDDTSVTSLPGEVMPTLNTMPQYDVFISYSRADLEAMRQIEDYLIGTAKLNVWSDENLKPDSDSRQIGVEHALKNSTCIMVLMSPASKQSSEVQHELSFAGNLGKVFLPVLLSGDASDAIPQDLVSQEYSDLREGIDSKLPDIAQLVREKTGK